MDMKSGRKKIEEEEIFLNPQRREIIFSLAKKPMSISELQRKLKINRGTLKHHLNILAEHKMIQKKQEKKQIGKPTFIHLIKNDWSEWAHDIQKDLHDTYEEFKKIQKEMNKNS